MNCPMNGSGSGGRCSEVVQFDPHSGRLLGNLARIPLIAKRLFVRAEFFMVTEEMRFAADFTICPSRTGVMPCWPRSPLHTPGRDHTATCPVLFHVGLKP